MSGLNENFVLSLCTKTWVRDSHGLYDYELYKEKDNIHRPVCEHKRFPYSNA